MEAKLQALRDRLREIGDLSAAIAVLRWDQSTYMPPRGAEARGRQIGMMGKMAHHMRVDPELGQLLEDLSGWADGLPKGDLNKDLLRVATRNYERAARVPAEFVSRLLENGTASYHAWAQARPADDFSKVAPYLERTVELSQEMAGFYPNEGHLADPLIDASDYGMTVASVRTLFAGLRKELSPLVQAICDKPEPETSFLYKHYDADTQIKFGLATAQRLGFDLERGRLDLTHHPYMTKFSLNDVRITTNIRDNDVTDGFFSTIHETGHALYELGLDPALEGTPLAEGASAGVHESQSRLWENIVGRSKPFWHHFYPRLQAAFPTQLEGV